MNTSQTPDALIRGSALAREIMRRSNLNVVIPVWSDGSNLNVGTIEAVHGRQVWVHRGHVDIVDGVWVAREASPDVADLVASIAR